MRARVFILMAAVVLGLVAAFMTARYLDTARAKIDADAQPVQVLVATEDIPRGRTSSELVEEGAITLAEVPRRYVSDQAVSSVKAIEGQVLAQPLSRGEQVTTARFQYPDQAGLAFSIPEGHVAIAISADDVKCVAGLIRPGDFVMVTATFDEARGLNAAQTKMLLPRVRVLAVGGNLSAEPASRETADGGGLIGANSENGQSSRTAGKVAPTITLALVPQDVEKLIYAEQQGQVWLALIPNGVAEVPTTPGRTMQTLYK
ncbi:MAG: Flp pilus assembly protein CpaB [Coriobacteriia bacterium]